MKKYIVVVLAVFALAACKSEIDNKPAAQVEEPTADKPADGAEKPAEPAAAAADAAPVSLIADKSSIGFVGAKVTGDHTGGFKTFTGKGTAAGDTLQSVEFTVDTKSVFTDAEKLTGHLQSPDFFDTAQFPEAKFVSKEITPAAADGKTHDVKGDMTIRGETKTITFPATIKAEGGVITATTEFTLKRFDFGIAYKGKADDLIKDDVLMKITLAYSKGE